MTKFKLVWLALTLSIATTASIRAFTTENLVAADTLPDSHAFVRAVEYFGDIATRNGEQLPSACVQVAMVRVNLGILADSMHSAELLSLPYLFRSEEHLGQVLRGPFGERLDRELANNGYVRPMYLYGEPRNLFCTKAIYGVSDLKGVRIRTL